MKITINDVPKQFEAPLSLKELLEKEGISVSKTIVTLNGETIMANEFSTAVLNDGDTLEFFSFVGGG